MKEDKVIAFFMELAMRGKKPCEMLSMPDSTEALTQGEECCFSIGGLYRLLCRDGSETYSDFKASLYKSRINEALAEFGYRIDIHHTTGNVDTSTYKLIAL